MRKLFTLLLVAATALTAHATDYNVPMVISVNDVTTEQESVISVTENDGLYDFYLKNFILQSPDGPMGVGNVELKGINPVLFEDAILLITAETVTITPGDDPTVPFWMASALPPVLVKLYGKIENNDLRCCIDIDLTQALGQIIHVEMGAGYQLPNRSFEIWHASKGAYEEPNAWHSFESATGSLASMAGHHIAKSTDAHSGEASARIYATSVFGVIANGTMTTGRMNAGSMSAAKTDNNAYLDMSMTDLDGAGKPFYTPMYSRPDSLVFWTKFNQGTATPDHPYATVSAVITDGTYYQDPEDKAYTNVVAKAQNKEIAVTGDEWKRISIPFVYTDKVVDPKAVLITISTNADPGAGSANDEVLVDDISFIYNSGLADIRIFGKSLKDFDPEKYEYTLETASVPKVEDVEVDVKSPTSYAVMEISYSEVFEKYMLMIIAVNGDMSKQDIYSVLFDTTATEVQTLQSAAAETVTYYTLDGIQVAAPQAGKIYLSRKSDGTVTKVLK